MALCLLLPVLFSCGEEMGVQGESNPLGIHFTYPQGWIVTRNDANLFQIAYQEKNTDSLVLSSFSVSILPSLAEGVLLREYVNGDYKKTFEDVYSDVSEIKVAQIQVDGYMALSCVFTCTGGGRKLRIRQVLCPVETSFYALTYVAGADDYDNHVNEINDILKSVVFTEKTSVNNTLEGTTQGAALGMLLATNDALYFAVNYPQNWDLLQNDGLILVKAKDANVTVSATAISTLSGVKVLSEDVGDFFDQLTKTFIRLSFEQVNEDGSPRGTEIRVAGREAASYVYAYTFSEVEFKCRLTAFYDEEGYFHTILYTASAQDYEVYLPQANAILNHFVLK
ncbi:MAG TPA: hypothetical protein DER23_06935 [Clostridiales bacterium]|nr:hypothetical protein [Clostridiales bacterium]